MKKLTDINNGAGSSFVGLSAGGTGANTSSTGPGYWMQASSGTPVTVSPILRSHAYNSANQTLTTGTDTAITFDSEVYDRGSIHSVASNTSRFVVPSGYDGFWIFTAQIKFAANATGVRQAWIQKNADGVVRGYNSSVAPTTTAPIQVTVGLELVAGDYLELMGFQNTGGNLDAVTGAGNTWVQFYFQSA